MWGGYRRHVDRGRLDHTLAKVELHRLQLTLGVSVRKDWTARHTLADANRCWPRGQGPGIR